MLLSLLGVTTFFSFVVSQTKLWQKKFEDYFWNLTSISIVLSVLFYLLGLTEDNFLERECPFFILFCFEILLWKKEQNFSRNKDLIPFSPLLKITTLLLAVIRPLDELNAVIYIGFCIDTFLVSYRKPLSATIKEFVLKLLIVLIVTIEVPSSSLMLISLLILTFLDLSDDKELSYSFPLLGRIFLVYLFRSETIFNVSLNLSIPLALGITGTYLFYLFRVNDKLNLWIVTKNTIEALVIILATQVIGKVNGSVLSAVGVISVLFFAIKYLDFDSSFGKFFSRLQLIIFGIGLIYIGDILELNLLDGSEGNYWGKLVILIEFLLFQLFWIKNRTLIHSNRKINHLNLLIPFSVIIMAITTFIVL